MSHALKIKDQAIGGAPSAWWGTALASVAFLAGCQPMLGRAPGQAAMQQPVIQAAYQDEQILNALQPAAGPQSAPYAPLPAQQQALAVQQAQAYYAGGLATLEGNQQALQQRLARIEQALLRLDKRMQLVERNELGRMSGANPAPVATTSAFPEQVSQAPQAEPLLAQTVRQTMQGSREVWAGEEPVASTGFPASLAQAGSSPYAEGFAPVSQIDNTIRSTLQAAPNRLPSLADQAPAATGRIPQSAGNMAVWTVQYEPSKVWPARDQLPASRAVVDLLRKSQTVTLVARGPNPHRPEFQERVRALSRYLAKVAALETVPISTLATPQLNADTIELLATP